MDGRDDENKNFPNAAPANNAAPVGTPQNSASPDRQAIFTPTASDNPVQNDNSPAPLIGMQGQALGAPAHSYFAHHPTHIPSTAQGDIILSSGSETQKKNKKPLIIGLIVGSITIIILILLFAILNRPGRKQVAQDFNRYANYVQDGENTEDDGNKDDSTWMIFDLYDDYSSAEITEFVNKTKEYYNEFNDLYTKSNLKINGLSSSLPAYKKMLDAILGYVSLNDNTNNLLKTYYKEGEEAAKKLMNEYVPSEISLSDIGDDGAPVDYIFANLRQYYTYQLRLAAIYARYGCIDEYGLKIGCTTDIMGDEYFGILDESKIISAVLDRFIDDIEPTFIEQTNNIREVLEKKK